MESILRKKQNKTKSGNSKISGNKRKLKNKSIEIQTKNVF